MNTIFSEISEQYKPIISLWLLRILYDLKIYTRIDTRYGIDEYDKIFNFIGLQQLVEKYEDKTLSKKKLRKILKPIAQQHEIQSDINQGALFKNMESFGNLIGMNTTEKTLLSFCIMLNIVHVLEKATDILGSISSPCIINIFSVVLKTPANKIRKALSSDALLYRTGLLRLSREGNGYFVYQVSVMGEISEVLLDEDQPDMMKSLTRFFAPSKVANLKREDFSYVEKDFQLIYRYLKSTCKTPKKGLNILIYGLPGTGKTEMVRTLATLLNMPLYEVAVDIDTDNALDDEDQCSRMDSYRLCQQVLKRKTKTLILFDEIEDAFIRDGERERFGIRTNTDAKKGSFNHLLESNPLPTLWVSNVINHIDEAIIRRFDYVMELKIPPKSVRIKIIKKHTSALAVSEQWINKISINESLAPALISRAVRVVSALNENDQIKNEASMERILSNTLQAMGYDKNLSNPHKNVLTYCLEALNPDYNLTNLQTSLQQKPQGGFCLYGPSGTGKSEFAHQIAKVLDKPLLIKRASDLLDPYIGMTERHIREMFEQAHEESALLLLDEADSFLRDRTLSRESWEVAQVNELLTQMEQFNGLFFCTTNLMDVLDQAALRRFDLKIKFDYLKPEQTLLLFKQVLSDPQQTGTDLDPTLIHNIQGLQGVTPGDFAIAVKQNRFSLTPLTPTKLLETLKKEIKFKRQAAFTDIGFMPHHYKK